MIFSKYAKKPVNEFSRWLVLDYPGNKNFYNRTIYKRLLSLIPVSILVIIIQFKPLGYQLSFLNQSKPEYDFFTGNKGGFYDTIGQLLFLNDKHELPFIPIPVHTNGAKDNLKKVDFISGFGLIQDGLPISDSMNNVRSIMDLNESPLQIVIKKDNKINDITDLRNKRIFIGATGSGTHFLSEQILKFYGMDSSSYKRLGCDWSFDEGIRSIQKGNCDAAFFLLPLNSTKLQNIAGISDYTLLDLKRTGPIKIHLPYLKIYKIPAGSYGAYNTFPEKDIQTVSMREILICSSKIPDRIIWKTIDFIKERKNKLNSSSAIFSIDPGNLSHSFMATPLHDGAKSYYSGKTSFQISDEILVYLVSLILGQFYAVRNIFKFTRFRILLTRLFDFDPFNLDKNKKRKVILYPEKRIHSIVNRSKAWYIQGNITEDQFNKLNNFGNELINNYKMVSGN